MSTALAALAGLPATLTPGACPLRECLGAHFPDLKSPFEAEAQAHCAGRFEAGFARLRSPPLLATNLHTLFPSTRKRAVLDASSGTWNVLVSRA